MSLPTPFAYPPLPHERTHGPRGYTNYGEYKPWLRDEFSFRCVYCLKREAWSPDGAGPFSADHFLPASLHPDGVTDYENLVYACVRCNSFKQAKIPDLDPRAMGMADHLEVSPLGAITALTLIGRDLIDLFHLDDAQSNGFRIHQLRVVRLKSKYPHDPVVHSLFLAIFGFPTNLPDLSKLRPPGGNSRPEGISASHFARRSRGELPEVY